MRFLIEQSAKVAILFFGGGVVRLPCNSNGGSPFSHTAYSRLTGSLLTGWNLRTYVRFRLVPMEQTAHRYAIPRRVERSGSQKTTKGILTASPPSLSLLFPALKPLTASDNDRRIADV